MDLPANVNAGKKSNHPKQLPQNLNPFKAVEKLDWDVWILVDLHRQADLERRSALLAEKLRREEQQLQEELLKKQVLPKLSLNH